MDNLTLIGSGLDALIDTTSTRCLAVPSAEKRLIRYDDAVALKGSPNFERRVVHGTELIAALRALWACKAHKPFKHSAAITQIRRAS